MSKRYKPSLNISIMRLNYCFLLYSIFFSSLLLSSCSDDDENQDDGDKEWSEQQVRSYVNTWIYDNMSDYYYWESQMPAKPSSNQDPSDFFESLIYKRDNVQGDRFSWIQENYVDLVNSLNGVALKDLGFEYMTVKMQDESVAYWVIYVKKGTDAEKKGLKRGDLIYKVNGTVVTLDNYKTLLKSEQDSNVLFYYNPTSNTTKEVEFSLEANYSDNPVYYSNVYTYGSKKIGYIVYNFFSPDNGDGSFKYDIALAKIFEDFNSKGVTDLVLDLRYNSGGYTSSATYLASAFIAKENVGKVFYYKQYNKWVEAALSDDAKQDLFQDKITVSRSSTYPITHLGEKIKTAYVLTGVYTASASELLINGLRPFMDVKTIGEKTVGKNVGSISIYEENDKHNKWGMQPIVSKSANSLRFSDYEGGFSPNFPVYERANYLVELGDPSEPLLAKAISEITGQVEKRSNKRSALSSDVQMLDSSLKNKPSAFQMFIDSKVFEDLKINR